MRIMPEVKKKNCHLEMSVANIPGSVSAINMTETWQSEGRKNVFFIEIVHFNEKNIIDSTYRLPNGDHNKIGLFYSEVCNISKFITREKNKTVLIAGDFNRDLIK